MNASKKLHDIFIDEKVPREVRDRIPLIIARNKILWAVGLKLSDACKINESTERVIKLSVKNKRKNNILR